MPSPSLSLRKPIGFPSRGAYWLAGAALLACVAILANGCTFGRDRDAGKAVLYRDHSDAVRTWDPANAYDTISASVLYSVIEQLYQYSYLKDTYSVEPLLAADLPKFSADQLTVTIPVR